MYNDEKFKAWKRQKIEDNIIKDVKIDGTTIKYVKNLFRWKKKMKPQLKTWEIFLH